MVSASLLIARVLVRRGRIVLSVLLLALLSDSQLLAQDAPTDALQQTVAKLGDAQFLVREQAEKDLIARGLPAKSAVVAGLQSADIEVRQRCRRLLQRMLELDLQQQIKAFEANQPGAELPSWTQFRERIGSDAAARTLFVSLIKEEPGLMLSYAASPEAGGDAFTARVRQFLMTQMVPNPNRRRQPSTTALTALLFVGADPQFADSLGVMELSQMPSWMSQADFRTAATTGPAKEHVRKIVVGWMQQSMRREVMRANTINYCLMFDLHELLPQMIDALRTKQTQGYALEAVARLGGRDYAEVLVPYLDDTTALQSMIVNGKVQVMIEVRDVALGWLIYHTGQNATLYDMPQAAAWFTQLKTNKGNGVSWGNFRFGDQSKRDVSIQKMRDWLSKHRLPMRPVPLPEDRGAILPTLVVPQPVAEALPEDKEQLGGLIMAESFELQRLNRARQMIQDERWAQAANELGKLTQQTGERWFQPQRGAPQYRELRTEAERLLMQLPQVGQDAFESQFGPLARKLLDAAVEAHDRAGIELVSKNYFQTVAGTEATYRLGNMDFDAGQMLAAVMRFEHLAAGSLRAAELEPLLSLKRAICWSRLGATTDAQRRLADVKAKHPQAMVTIEGEPRELFATPTSAADWLAVVAPSNRNPQDWLTSRGQTHRNPVTDVSPPVLLAAMSSPVVTDPIVKSQQLNGTLNELLATAKKLRLGRLPSMQPIVIGDAIVFRSLTELRAVNGRGELLWSVPHEDALWEMLQPGNEVRLSVQTAYFKDFLMDRIWEDSCFGTLASDGRLVFAVQSDRIEVSPELQRLSVSSAGQLMLNTTPQDGVNRLAAFDLGSGKCVWEWRSTDSKTATRFLGAPLVIGDNLFVIAQNKDETTLRELDASTGQMLRHWLLQADPIRSAQVNQMWGMRFRPKVVETVAGSSPSYSDGLVLCRTGANRVVAIDLATSSLRWAYQVPRAEATAVNIGNPWARVPREAVRQTELDHWCESSLVIADGAVLLALPDSNDLRCLDLADGRLRWTVPRQDGLFVAGVHQGRVLVAGRSGLRAYRLDDGRNAWPHESVAWPLAAVPSGLGYLSQGRCCVPLSSSELISIDIASGQIAARANSWKPMALGNLVASAGNVYSLGTDGLLKFKDAASHLEPLKQHIREQPTEALFATGLGEALLLSGRTTEGVEQLVRTLKLDPSPESRARQRLLGLITDNAALDPELRQSVMAAIGYDKLPAAQRWLMQVDYAVSRDRAGDSAVALEQLLAAAKIEVDLAALTDSKRLRHESAARSVRNDRWFQGQLEQRVERLEPQQRERFQQQIAAMLPTTSPDQFLALFGGLPIARDVRLSEVDRLAAGSELLPAELQLRTALDASQPADERELLLRLKKLWEPKTATSLDRFAHWERQIGGRHDRERFSNGLRGSEIVEAEPLDSPIRKLRLAPPQWTSLRPLVMTQDVKAGTPVIATNEPKATALMLPHDRLDAPSWLGHEPAKGRWLGLDARGRQLWELPISKSFNLSYNMPGIPQARRVGPLMVVWAGQSIHAIEIDGAQSKQLWSMQTTEQNPNEWQAQIGNRRIQRVQILAGNNRGARPETRWWAFIAQPNYVCFQRNRELQAVEPLTSQLLWKRDDLPIDCDLLGDEQVVCAFDADSSRVQVLSAIDGRTLANRTLPARSSWAGLRGRQLAYWPPVEEVDEEHQFLCGLDLLTERELWRHRFAIGSKHYLMVDTELAVVEPSGRFAIVDLISGQMSFDTPTEPLPKLENVFVLESFDRYLLFADVPLADPVEAPGFMRFNQMQINVTGRCLAVNRSSGKVAWSRTIPNQGFNSLHLREHPLLPLARVSQKLVALPNGQGQNFQTESNIQMLNVRTGDIEYEETTANFRLVELQHDPSAQQVKYRGTAKQVDFDFSQR